MTCVWWGVIFCDSFSGDGGADRESVKGEGDNSVRKTKHGGESSAESATVWTGEKGM